jgi:hypothetical protein
MEVRPTSLNELSHRLPPTGIAVAVPVYGAARGPRAISVTAIVLVGPFVFA